MLAVLGFITVILMLVLIMTKKASPLVALIAVPIVTGIIACGFFVTDPENAPGVINLVSLALNFARQHLAERLLDLLQRAALPNRVVVGAEQRVVRKPRRQLDDGGIVDGHHLGTLDVSVHRRGIDRVAGEQQLADRTDSVL